MSSILVCPICGKDQKCGPHEGSGPDLKDTVAECPLKKGAIYVYVRDDAGLGVKDVRVKCDGKGPLSDAEGFAIFDPRDEGPHPTGIHLTESEKQVTQDYYAFSPESLTPTVSPGKITLVVFQVNRYATLEVIVKRSDKPAVLVKDVEIQVESAEKPDPGMEKSRHNSAVPFPRRKQVMHTVRAALAGADKDNYTFDGDAVKQHVVDAKKSNMVEFLVTPAGWIKFKVVDQNGPLGQTAKFTVEGPGIAKEDKDTEVGALLSLPKLEPGAVKVHGVTLPEGYELVEVKPG